MKKLIVLLFVCAAAAMSCGKKVMPGSDANNQSKPANDKSATSATQSPATNTSATTAPSFNNMQKSIPPNPDGPRSVSMEQGKTVFVTKCGGCHALKNPGDYTVDQMNTILKAEIPKAKLSSKEAEQVTAYLLANSKK
ncbi:MAG TPA: hypothetical protein VIV35_08500 [Chitinophagaceae bacterium]